MWFILLCMILYCFYCSAMGTMIGLIKYYYSYSYSHYVGTVNFNNKYTCIWNNAQSKKKFLGEH